MLNFLMPVRASAQCALVTLAAHLGHWLYIGDIAHWAEALTCIRKLSIFPLFVTTLNPNNSG